MTKKERKKTRNIQCLPISVLVCALMIQLYASFFTVSMGISTGLILNTVTNRVFGGLAQVLKHARITFRINVRFRVVQVDVF